QKIAEPMRYISNVVISLVLGFLLTFMYVLTTMRIKKASRKKILNASEASVVFANVVGTKTGTHKVYSPVESSSSGGSSGGGFSGGGGGGGGGFSGGGGGHSF
ncbi:MAG: TPM domain-containing protein, partial [Bacilli bacterium]|nr:TPM domain-containing protein [Bacilli bacterium]